MPTQFRASACLGAALVLTMAGCGGGSSPGTAASSPSSTPTSTTPVVSATPTPSSTPVPTVTPTPAPAPRTSAQLAKALLALGDLPAGFSIDTSSDSGDDDDDVTLSSKDARCAKLVALSNADSPPGSKASAGASYSAGSDGPFIDESLDAMASTAAVRALQKSFKQAITSCRTMTLTIPGQGRSPISVREVAAPKSGTDPVAVRFTATSGPLEGLEVTMITTGVNDVVLGLTVLAGDADTIEGATAAAVHKAQAVFGTGT